MITIEEAFGLVIRKMRKERGISQEKLSFSSMLDRTFISQLECGKKQPTLVTIFELANALGVAVADIIAEVETLLRCHCDLNYGKSPLEPILYNISTQEKGSKMDVSADSYSGSETILLVDDEKYVRDCLEEIISSYGYRVISASNGQEAVDKFKEHADQVQLILMDLVMPEKSGLEAYKEIIGICPDAKVLLVSGYSPESLGSVVAKDTFINKPVRPSDLLRIIRDRLDDDVRAAESDSAP